jgi:hypothetical protein
MRIAKSCASRLPSRAPVNSQPGRMRTISGEKTARPRFQLAGRGSPLGIQGGERGREPSKPVAGDPGSTVWGLTGRPDMFYHHDVITL